MAEVKQITSTQNPFIKKILALRDKSKERRETGHFVLEGTQEIKLALDAGYQVEQVLFNEAIYKEWGFLESLRKSLPEVRLVSVSKTVYQKLAYRQSTEGLLCIARSKPHALEQLQLKTENPLVLVAEAPEKPGNIGALLRTADAAGLDAVIIANPKTDLYNPNIIRSSVGCVFTNQIALASSKNALRYLKEQKITILGTALTAPEIYTEVDFKGPCAIVMGTEATGLSPIWLHGSDKNIIIPMKGKIDSLNVSVSASILIFEALRQRKSMG